VRVGRTTEDHQVRGGPLGGGVEVPKPGPGPRRSLAAGRFRLSRRRGPAGPTASRAGGPLPPRGTAWSNPAACLPPSPSSLTSILAPPPPSPGLYGKERGGGEGGLGAPLRRGGSRTPLSGLAPPCHRGEKPKGGPPYHPWCLDTFQYKPACPPLLIAHETLRFYWGWGT